MIFISLSSLLVGLVGYQVPLHAKLPGGASTEFRDLLERISKSTKDGQWERARDLAVMLPTTQTTVGWKISDAPTTVVDDVEAGRDDGVTYWRSRHSEMEAKVSASGSLMIQYADIKATKLFFGQTKEQPRLTIVFPLVRGVQKHVVSRGEVRNDVLYAFAKYYGLADNPSPLTIVGRTDESDAQVPTQLGHEFSLAKANMALVDSVRKAIASKTTIDFAKATAKLNTTEFDLGSVTQGENSELEVSITNSGSDELVALIEANCGCVIPQHTLRVEPGKTGLAHVDLETIQFTGNLTRYLTITTNDADHPHFTVPIKINIQPRYRFISPPGQVFVSDDKSIPTDVFLVISPGLFTKVDQVLLESVNGSVSIEKWHGDIVDPENDEHLKNQNGFKLHVTLAKQLAPGRVPGRIILKTNDEKFRVISTPIYVQSGIVAMPDNIYFGSIGYTATNSKLLLSRPGVPFKILGVDSSSVHFKAEISTIRPGSEYRVTVVYDGKAKTGELSDSITIRTDDTKQPKITIPLRGVVR